MELPGRSLRGAARAERDRPARPMVLRSSVAMPPADQGRKGGTGPTRRVAPCRLSGPGLPEAFHPMSGVPSAGPDGLVPRAPLLEAIFPVAPWAGVRHGPIGRWFAVRGVDTLWAFRKEATEL